VCCCSSCAKPSPRGGLVCPCTSPCCAHQYNDPKISADALKAYRIATAICQEAGSQQYCFPDNSSATGIGCCDPQGNVPTGSMPNWLCTKLIHT
jgi:hypothetical protein